MEVVRVTVHPRALRAVTVASYAPLMVAFPVLELGTAYLLGLWLGPSAYRPLGLPEAWDLRHLFVAGIVSRAIGMAMSLGVLLWADRTGGLTHGWRRAAWIALAIHALGFLEFASGLVGIGCAFNPHSPASCQIGN